MLVNEKSPPAIIYIAKISTFWCRQRYNDTLTIILIVSINDKTHYPNVWNYLLKQLKLNSVKQFIFKKPV